MKWYERNRDRNTAIVLSTISLLIMCGILCVSVHSVDTDLVEAEPSAEPIRLGSYPGLSPDGSVLAFSWRRDIWTVPVTGGEAKQLTRNPANDRRPRFSPDGREIAFTSDREGGLQIYVMPAQGGKPEQLTFHTSGCWLEDWFPDGKSLLVKVARDHFWRHVQRFCSIQRHERSAENLLFDAYGDHGVLSPNGRCILFTREYQNWFRKGYRGSQASQIWMYDMDTKEFTKLLVRETGCGWPLWKPDGSGFYYVGAQSGSFNLWEYGLESREEQQLTHFEDDSVLGPCISRDGSTIVFRHLFDFYRYHPTTGAPPERIEIWDAGDAATPRVERRTLEEAGSVAFSKDGLEVAFISGGDLWVMDTELRKPKQITNTTEREYAPVFSPEEDFIIFVSDRDGHSDIWKAERVDAEKYWWQNDEFRLERLTQDDEVDSRPSFSPDGSRIAFVKGNGDLWTMNPEGEEKQKILDSWDGPQYNWSPDGKWFVYSVRDKDGNRDIWLLPADGSAAPFNLSRHPNDDTFPVWSPDGKIIAFTGRRLGMASYGSGREVDIHFVWLRKEDDERSQQERTLEKALEKMEKVRKKKADKPKSDSKEEEELPEVLIDFDDIHERIRSVSIPDSNESDLFWSHDSRKLAFTATVDGKRGTYTIEIPGDLKPKLLSTKIGSQARWLKQDNQIVWRQSDGILGSLSAKAEAKEYKFSVNQEVDIEARYRAGFDQAWRTMRDRYYDERLGNRDWDAVRRKYIGMAEKSGDIDTFSSVVNLMLGELNGSHVRFTPRRNDTASKDQWSITTVHLGVRFDPDHKGPGLKVRDVLSKGPADHAKNRIEAGEVIMSINGVTVDPTMDLTTVLNQRPDQDIDLSVRNAQGEDREVTLRPISYTAARNLLYEKWVRDNRRKVEEASEGTLGYLHIRGMYWTNFCRFEEELYSAGAGRDGLVIDVRENPGGNIGQRLLAMLTEPTPTISVIRGAPPGHYHSYSVYAIWSKPIVVLCNQNTACNAEIFCHNIIYPENWTEH